MNSMICKPTESSVYLPSIKELCIFLSDYAAGLLGCGATCIRIEKNITRISLFFGYDSEMTIMPSHIHLTIWNKEHTDSYSIIRRMHKTGISFDMNTKLSKLSWEIADGKIGFQEATLLAERIYHTSSVNPRVVLFLASCANASFCRLFGGDFISMGVVFIATLVGYYIKQIMLEDGADVRFVFFCSAFFSSVIGAGGHIFGWGTTPEIALGTSVLYLIPGIPYINSVSDMLDGHYICAFSRFMNAIVLTACLSTGLCGGLFLMGLGCF
ncbi:MAG: threonine/serine exporter family protein [Parabacteroides sp.]|nr:threonine/serine exporter family protein [Parabacteroides sp.]